MTLALALNEGLGLEKNLTLAFALQKLEVLGLECQGLGFGLGLDF